MGTPATTARATPAGTKQTEGFSTTIAFAEDSDISIWEKTVQDLGATIGDKIDITDMHNTAYRTFAAKTLKEILDSGFTAAYSADQLSQILAVLGVEGAITIHHPNGGTTDFFGYLASFEKEPNAEGEQPVATAVIVVTNIDPSDGAEQAPVYTAPA